MKTRRMGVRGLFFFCSFFIEGVTGMEILNKTAVAKPLLISANIELQQF